jgi:serine phosphatase RsbU (regulator of sigma subunit)
LEGYDRDWIDVGNRRNKEYTNLPPGDYTFKVIACNSDGFWNPGGVSFSFYKKPHFYQTTWFYILTALFAIFAVFTGYRFRMRQLIAREKILSRLVGERTLELEMSRQIIEEKNRNILAGIEYAGTIQQAMLPLNEKMAKVLADYFVIFEPKAIVSGDFYWFHPMGDRYFIAAVDCTGHGVPGALLSMIGKILLDEILHEKQVTDPAALLAQLHFGVRTELKQEEKESKNRDGMDAALCMVDLKEGKLTFAGAKRPLYYVTGSQLREIKGDSKSIGGPQKEEKRSFTNHNIDIHPDTVIYLTTDGFADQGDPGNRKFGTRRLKTFLETHAHMDMARQKELLLLELKKHRGTEEQRDDITVIGIKLK